jgi:O-antigen/teichoic acid export membrane protein
LKPIRRALRGSSIFSNYFWSLLNLVLSKGLRFFGIVLCVRQIGIEPWGQVASTFVTVAFLGFIVDQGLGSTPQVFKVGDRALDWTLVRVICRYRLAVALGLSAVLAAAHGAFGLPSGIVLAYACILPVRALSIEWLYHRRERYHFTLFIGLTRMIAFFMMVVLLVHRTSSPILVVGIEMAAEAIGVATGYAMLGKLGLTAESGSGRLTLADILLFSLPVLLNGMMDSALGSADILVLRHLRGFDVVGQVDIGGKVGMTYFFLGATLIQIILPKLARLHGAGETERMKQILTSTGKALLMLGTALLIPSFYFSHELLQLIFKRAYPLTEFVFQWLPIWVYVTPLTMMNMSLLLATNRRKDYLLGTAISAVVNVGGNFLLIQWMGGGGVVVARFISEGIFLIYSFLRLPPAFRIGRLRNSGIYFANLAAQLLLFRLCAVYGHRALFLSLALALFVAVIAAQRTLTRGNLSVLVQN